MATVVREFPRAVRVIENTWITLSDGTRLAAKIWLPDDAEDDPVPGVLEFLPYRKRDGTAARDELLYPYLAGHGYAGVRVDLRGHGDSDGLPEDEYTPQEQADGAEVIAWIAEQPWCTGAVGMHGISWGGFNGLQIAALRPPALRAIITLCSTDDRYSDDVHYKGGLVLGLDMLHWATYMLLANAEPPDPEMVGADRWRDLWLGRIDASQPLAEIWLDHQRRDAYWKQGSVIEDHSAITAAVYAVGGWQDGYTNAVPRLLEGLSCPRKGLIGPWGHAWPQNATPLPAIGFLQESLRWWDHWLKGIDNGIMQEPMLRAWVQDSVRPATTHHERPGRFVSADAWPPPASGARPAHGRSRVAGRARAGGGVQDPGAPDLRAGRRCLVRRGRDGRRPRRPARRGRHVADVRLGAAGTRPARAGLPAGAADALVRPAAGAGLRAPLRGVPRRRLEAGHAADPEPLPP